MTTIEGDLGVEVMAVTYDSRRVAPGGAFFTVRGFVEDGHKYIPEAVERGAGVLVVEGEEGLRLARLGLGSRPPERAPVLVSVPDVRAAMGRAAANFYGHPSRKLRVIGVTGTNGKTTTTHLVRELLEAQGRSCGLIGTVQTIAGGEALPAGRTTPEAFDLQGLADRMLKAGDTYLSMEVGSHALCLGRVLGFEFDAAVFTNLTQDHLDFHGDMESYFEAKSRLFTGLGLSYLGELKPGPKTAILNADDEHSERLAGMCRVPVVTYGLGTGRMRPGLLARDVKLEPGQTTFTLVAAEGLGAGLGRLGGFEAPVRLSMTGRHNVSNALAALGAVLAEGLPPEKAVAGLAAVHGAAGRFETVDAGQDFMAVVDYAHTPDGLENVLQAARALHPKRLITVFGCGGDRDRTKRPLMGGVVGRLADLCVVTSDNPRSERPEAIIDDIEPGLRRLGLEKGQAYLVEPDRAQAIALAVRVARRGDLVLVAGKGHETYQIFADRTIHFDDREVLAEAIEAEKGGGGAGGR